MAWRGCADPDFSVERALQAGRVRRRHVQLMQRRPRQQIRPADLKFTGVPIDVKNTSFVPAGDAVRDLTEKSRVQVRGHQPQNRPLYRTVALQSDVVLSWFEDRTVVVNVRHLHTYDSYGTQTTCNSANNQS